MVKMRQIDVAAWVREAANYGVHVEATDDTDIESFLRSHGEGLKSEEDNGKPLKGSAAAKAKMKALRGMKGKSSGKPSANGKRDKADDDRPSKSARDAKTFASQLKRGVSGRSTKSASAPRPISKGGDKPASLKMISKKLDGLLSEGEPK